MENLPRSYRGESNKIRPEILLVRTMSSDIVKHAPEDFISLSKTSKLIFNVEATDLQLCKTQNSLNGVCLDNGDQTFVIGYTQTREYNIASGLKTVNSKSQRELHFEDECFPSISQIPDRIPTLHCSFICVLLDKRDPKLPLFTGLDILDRHKRVVENVYNVLWNKVCWWNMPVVCKE